MHWRMIRIDTDFRFKNTDSPHEIVACLPITITVPIKLSITITVVIEKAITITIVRLQLLVYHGNDSRLFIRHVHLQYYHALDMLPVRATHHL